MSVRSALHHLSTLGLEPDEPNDERRRLMITNQGAMIAIVTCMTFVIGFQIAGTQFAMLEAANATVVAISAGCFFLTATGRRKAAKVTLLVVVHILIILSSLKLGLGVGFHYYFFLLAVFAFLFFGEGERWLRNMFAAASAFCCLFVCIVAPIADVMDLPTMVPETLNIVSAMAVMGTIVFVVHLFTGDTVRAEARLAVEHARSERLLLNVLPKSISARLKDDDKAIADGFAEVTVLFADLVGFTELSQRLDPAALVNMLNHIFSAFDDLAAELGLEKIKTIGDCYMVAAGLPDHRKDHVAAAARMALGMLSELKRINAEAGYALRLRIGLHTGPVIAGVIGKRKFIYDLWGDTVNTASRMESSGVEQEIQVSKQVADQLVGKFDLLPRGMIKVKGKGELETFLLRGELKNNVSPSPAPASSEPGAAVEAPPEPQPS